MRARGLAEVAALFTGGLMRRTAFAAAAAAILITSAPAASAAPDRSVALSSHSRTGSWTSGVNVGPHVVYTDLTKHMRCTTRCDQTLIKVSTPGIVRVEATKSGPLSSNDFYVLGISIHRSDANGGKAEPVKVRYSRSRDSESLTTAPLLPGLYLFEVEWREGAGFYTGTATLTPARRP